MKDRFRIHIRKVDRDEFTAYQWGTIDPDGSISPVNESEAKFGEFEEYIHHVLPKQYQEDPVTLETVEFWLERGRSYGSQAHRIKTTIEHPLLGRHLAYPEFDLAAILHGLDHSDSSCETVHEMVQIDPFARRVTDSSEETASVMFGLPDLVDVPTAVTETMGKVFEVLATQELSHKQFERKRASRYRFRLTRYGRPIARIHVSRDALESVQRWEDTDASVVAETWEIRSVD